SANFLAYVSKLAGQQKCVKTTCFNALTGSSQHVGNFPGVTVDRKDGAMKGHADTVVTDLPGVYSLSPYTAEEVVTRDFILTEKPRAIINILDAGNMERNLYLTVQLMELGIPMVLGLNMMDEVRGNGGSIDVNGMESALGLPVIPVSAKKNEGVHELMSHAIHVARYQEAPVLQDFCDKDDHGGAVHRCLHGIMHLVEDHAAAAGIPAKFAASKIVEGDQPVIDALGLTAEELEIIEKVILQMERERGLDRKAAIADMRFNFIEKLCSRTVKKPEVSKGYVRSRRIDSVLTGRWTALPLFITVMALVLWLSIDVLGSPLQSLLQSGMDGLGALTGGLLEHAGVNEAMRSLIVNGIFGGVGAVVSFIPVIIILFFFLSMLEDSGYMARVAFVTDKLLRKLGLSGRSIVPLLIGLGCSVPAVMATRTLPSARDRKRTILLTPFMSCSAKIPVYAFLSDAFFPGHGGLVLISLYLTGIAMGILIALVSRGFRKGRPSPFVMELPNYRMPAMKNVGLLLWDKAKDFIQKAFTLIFVASVLIWFLQSFTFSLEFVPDGQGSMLAWAAGLLAPLFSPLGIGDWRVVTAFISGFLAKETVVSSMQVLNVTDLLNTVTAVPVLVFCLLYTPCIATIGAVRRELGTVWALTVVVSQCVLAWVAAFIAYRFVLFLF
ncbi:MAG: ferrous iron transport protein B, partial [Bacteroidales bacterium]|nr:ferrous iron transport protein B [Bacteroidales bacterium]